MRSLSLKLGRNNIYQFSIVGPRGRGMQGSPRGGGMMRGQVVQRGRGSPARMSLPMGRGRGVQPQPVQTRVPPRKNRNAPSQVGDNYSL